MAYSFLADVHASHLSTHSVTESSENGVLDDHASIFEQLEGVVHGLCHLGVARSEHLVARGDGIPALAGDLSQYLRPNPSFHERGAGQPSQTDVPTLALHDGAQDQGGRGVLTALTTL